MIFILIFFVVRGGSGDIVGIGEVCFVGGMIEVLRFDGWILFIVIVGF